jgi:protein-L-isoaspartate(D-aspartate) O-methyltransferase
VKAPHRGIGMTSQRTRQRLVDRLRQEGVGDERVLATIAAVPRHMFLDEALASRAYEDTALPIGCGQTISQPYIVARMTEVLLAGGPCRKVLEVGTGSGYQAVVLARLVEEVYTVERVRWLLNEAMERAHRLGVRNIRFRHADGALGLPDSAPYDGILVTAAPPGVPAPLLDQLAPGGRIVIPVGAGSTQELLVVTREQDGFTQERLEAVRFVPLIEGRI